MIRTTLDKAYIKRTIRPLYGWSQATPKSCFLDPAWDRSVPIWPGMAMMRTGNQLYTLCNATGAPAGLSALYIGGDSIDEVADAGVNVLAVWSMGDDAEFEILAPAFDNTLSWVDPGTGVDTYVYAQTAGATRGKLVPGGTAGASAVPIGRLLGVISPTKIVVGGLIAGVRP